MLTQLPLPNLFTHSWSQLSTLPRMHAWLPQAVAKSSIIHRVTCSKRSCKEHGNPMAKEALGDACHWNQLWNTVGWSRKVFMRDRQASLLGFTFYKSLKGMVQYVHIQYLYIFKRCYCHKGIKQGKADHLKQVICPTPPPHAWVPSL